MAPAQWRTTTPPSRPRLQKPPSAGNPYMRDLVETSLLAAIIGTLAGFVAIGVRVAIAFMTGLFFRQEASVAFVSPMVNGLGPLVILVPVLGFLLAYLVVRFVSHDTRTRGAGEIIDSVKRHKGRVSVRSVFGHAASTIVSVGAGGSAGREGAMVQLGAALGMLASILKGASIRHRKILIAAGGAGAIAGTFNTPIAGVIFGAEVILIEWSTRSFVPLVVASAFSTQVTTRVLGTTPAFPIPPYELASQREIFLYVVLGLLAGLLAIAVFRMLDGLSRLFARMPGPAWGPHVVGGLVVGVIGYFVPEIFGVGYETVREVLDGRIVASALVLILVAKLAAFTVTRAAGGASGAFSPSLFLGASLGGAFGTLVHALWPAWTATSGAYALVGMAAMYAAVTRASLTAVVMLYEMTHTFSIIIPVMIAVVIADALAKAYGGTSLFASQKDHHTVDTDASVNILDIVTVREIMTRKVETVEAEAPVRSILEKRFRTGHQGYPVVDGGRLVGIVTATDLREKVAEGDLDHPIRDYMTPDPVCVLPDDTAHEALTEMVRLDVGHLPVVDPKDRRSIVGFLTRQDLIGVERRVLEEEHPGEPIVDLERLPVWPPWPPMRKR